MLIKFDIKQLRTELYWVKSLSTALGGSVRIVDEERTTAEGFEFYNRISVPLAVIRQFKKQYKTTKYIRPCLMAITYYGDRAIALERHPAGCMGNRFSESRDGTMQEWRPASVYNIENIIGPLVGLNVDTYAVEKSGSVTNAVLVKAKRQWYFDGRYMFSFKKSIDETVAEAEKLSSDGRFRTIEVDAIGLHELQDVGKTQVAQRSCMVYVAQNGEYAISPPIWKHTHSVRMARVASSEGASGSEREMNFDKVDEAVAVNLSFALKAAAELSEEFGFDAIEPLNLPQLMIKLNTINLPKIPSEVKDTFDSGIQFTHALAWLLGFARRCETLETYATIRSLLKYLTASGVYFRQSFSAEGIFQKGHNLDSVPQLSVQDALTSAKALSVAKRLDILRNANNYRARNAAIDLTRAVDLSGDDGFGVSDDL